MVDYQGEKMSKSLGNLVIASDLLATYHPDAIRLLLASHHYRTPWEYQDGEIEDSASLAADLREAAAFPAYGIEDIVDVSSQRERFYNALDDDLNTPLAVAALREVGQAILEAPEEEDVRDAQETLRDMSDTLGLTLAS